MTGAIKYGEHSRPQPTLAFADRSSHDQWCRRNHAPYRHFLRQLHSWRANDAFSSNPVTLSGCCRNFDTVVAVKAAAFGIGGIVCRPGRNAPVLRGPPVQWLHIRDLPQGGDKLRNATSKAACLPRRHRDLARYNGQYPAPPVQYGQWPAGLNRWMMHLLAVLVINSNPQRAIAVNSTFSTSP